MLVVNISMREVRISDMFDDFGLFDMKQIKENLEDYVGYSFKDICLKFCNMNNEIVDVKLIRDYCMENYDKLLESNFIPDINEKIIRKREIDYNYFINCLVILRGKGLKNLYLIYYLSNGESYENLEYENYIKKLDISHVGSIVCGRDLKRIIEALLHTIQEYMKLFDKINDFNTYNSQNIDDFALSCGDVVYPSKSLINKMNGNDKTSIALTKKQILKNRS